MINLVGNVSHAKELLTMLSHIVALVSQGHPYREDEEMFPDAKAVVMALHRIGEPSEENLTSWKRINR